MDEDPRFPNRKKKRDWDEMSALDKPPEAEATAAPAEPAEEVDLPMNVYRVLDAARKTKEDEARERQELYAFRDSIPEIQQAKVEAPVYIPIDEAPAAEQTAPKESKSRLSRFAESQTRVFATIGVGLGVLIGVIVASLLWFTGNPTGRYDLGPVTSTGAGLKGHLFVEWEKQLNYRLSIEPDDPARLAAFATAVASSPRPLSVEIHLQDTEGFVLCSKEILLRYDARNAIGLAPPPNPEAKTNAPANSAASQPAPAIDPAQVQAQAEAQEAAREKGKDLFKNQVGSDGQITSIGAQGSIPCTAKGYEKAVAWSFTPSFPAIAEQDALLERQQQAANGGRSAEQAAAARDKAAAKAKPAQKIVPFSMEGDDSIVEFDASRGMIETTSGRVFFIDRSGGSASDPRWQDYPVEIHYSCDRTAECMVTHRGVGALHVRMR